MTKLLTNFILILCCTPLFAQIPCNVDDSLALVDLGNQLRVTTTNLPITNTLNGSTIVWDTAPVSLWQGVFVTQVGTEYRVDSIDLSGRNLSGVIPAGIFDGNRLQQTIKLDLSGNGITDIQGALRSNTTGSTPSLEYIDISNNVIVGQRNRSFLEHLVQNLPNINTLEADGALDRLGLLVDNSNGIQYGSSNIERLILSNNALFGSLELTTILAAYPNLEQFDISSNNLSGINFNAANTTLEEFLINQNDLAAYAPLDAILQASPSLEVLQANGALISTATDAFVFTAVAGGYPNLEHFAVANNGLTGQVPAALLENAPNIEIIQLQDNNLTGVLPQPAGVANLASNSYEAYAGLANLKEINLSNNQLDGNASLFWLFGQQIAVHALGTANTPLESFDISNNNFEEILPRLDIAAAGEVVALSNKFAQLQTIDVSGNALDFNDLLRIKKILNLKRIVGTGPNGIFHYIPQFGTTENDFQYHTQDSIGIGGVRRRNQGGSLTIAAGRQPIENEADASGSILPVVGSPIDCNIYSWETFDSVGNNPVVLGQVIFGGYLPGPASNNSYRPGGQAVANVGAIAPAAMHTLGIEGTDTLLHHNKLYSACVTNDSFPNLTLCMKKKRVEVGPCIDASGNAVQCQTMVVQFKPSVLAGLTPAQQDSLKRATRESMGAEPIDACLCGDIELWGVSDTAMVEGRGSGTKRNTTRSRGRAELQSADPNYALMDGNSSSTLPDTLAIQQGQGNTTATTLVAIIDSGVDYDYPSLRSFISEGAADNDTCMSDAAWGYNFVARNNNANDDHGHGTAVAGVVTGLSSDNLLPYTTNSPDIGFLPLKYTDKNGSGTLFNATCALHYAARYQRTTANGDTAKVRVINCSWGYYGDPCMVLENAIDYVGNNCGILLVASAGNDMKLVQGMMNQEDWHWPSNSITDEIVTNVDNVLAVAAIDNHTSNSLSSYSNYGDVHIDMAAKGTHSTTRAGTNNNLGSAEGTSFAAAQVSRAAALLFDKYPSASYYSVKYALMQGVDTLQTADAQKLKSQGRLNYAKADSIMNRIINLDNCLSVNAVVLNTNTLENATEYLVQLYPNPVQNELYINLDYQLIEAGTVQLQLYNAQGQLLQQQAVNQTTTTIGMQDLPKGMYLIQLQAGDQQWTRKIIK